MKGKARCKNCRKTFEWYRSEKQVLRRESFPQFCSHDCRHKNGGTGAIKLPRLKISDLSEEKKLDRLKSSFNERVIIQDNCWGWNGPVDQGGYPVMGCRRSCGSDRGHRASWLIHKGKIPKGMYVCHACDNPICTNPKHLWIGTHRQNNDDKISKGREAHNIPSLKQGSSNGASKLKDEQIKEIRILLEKKFTSRDIGKQYGVSKTTILRIKNGTHWKHVKD